MSASTSNSFSRPATSVLPPASNTPSFILASNQKSYKHQYSNIYFLRLQALKEIVVQNAKRRWQHLADKPTLVPRVLEVTKGKICYVVGTVYMEMPLKPNVLVDLARDNSIPPPPPVSKFYSSEDKVMLEDESGRIRLVGDSLKTIRLTTGVILGVLGMETPNGDFEVVDHCFAGLAPQVATDSDEEMNVDGPSSDPWIGVISGLEVGSEASSDARIQMLIEYLTAETGLEADQVPASQISRLIIAGDSLAPITMAGRGDYQSQIEDKKARKNAQDTSVFTPHPIHNLASHLLDIGRTLPIHVLPGETDPAGTILPQQPLPRAMFGEVSKLPSFVCESNPTYIRLAPGIVEDEKTAAQKGASARTLLVHSGQPLNDIFKYLPNRHNSRLALLEATLKWRHMAPTAPDTLWCHPYVNNDPFILKDTPDIYLVGGQTRFGTKLVVGEDLKKRRIQCRVVMVPNFSRTGTLVLVNLRSLEVKCVQFGVSGMTGAGGAPEEVKLPKATQMPAEPLSSEQQMGGSPGPM